MSLSSSDVRRSLRARCKKSQNVSNEMSGQMSSYKQIEASDNDTCLKAKRAREIIVRLNAIKKVNENAEKENVRKSELAHTKEMMLKAEI